MRWQASSIYMHASWFPGRLPINNSLNSENYFRPSENPRAWKQWKLFLNGNLQSTKKGRGRRNTDWDWILGQESWLSLCLGSMRLPTSMGQPLLDQKSRATLAPTNRRCLFLDDVLNVASKRLRIHSNLTPHAICAEPSQNHKLSVSCTGWLRM